MARSLRNKQFVLEGITAEPLWTKLRRQIFLGSDDFIEKMQNKIDVLN